MKLMIKKHHIKKWNPVWLDNSTVFFLSCEKAYKWTNTDIYMIH